MGSSGQRRMRSQDLKTPTRAFSLAALFWSVIVLTLALYVSRALPRLTVLSSHLRHFALPRTAMSSYAKELEVAQLAVQRATILTKRVFHEKAKGTVSKDDKSPVTIGVFGALVLIISVLKVNFPQDEIVAEEEADQLRGDDALKSTIWGFVQPTRLDDAAAEETLGGPVKTVDALLDLLAMGKSMGGYNGWIWAGGPGGGAGGGRRGGRGAV